MRTKFYWDEGKLVSAKQFAYSLLKKSRLLIDGCQERQGYAANEVSIRGGLDWILKGE